MDADALKKEFRQRYGCEPRLYRAPGRVNLIGEHTDYNDGFVFPAAIDCYIWLAAAPRPDRNVFVYSLNFSEAFVFSLDETGPQRKGRWSDYPHGVALLLEQAGHRLSGADLLISGEVPPGAGLSSSAALEVVTGYALLDLAGVSIGRAELAQICQRAENEFVGARCGLMDQFTVCRGQAGQALLLDCRTLDFQLLPLPPEICLVICDTLVRHTHAGGQYNTRRAECEEGARLLGVRALRDVSLNQLEAERKRLPANIYLRCRHVVSENGRALEAAQALKAQDLQGFGALMAESHRSLRDDFAVSCRELDMLVELAGPLSGVFGSRMTGGGFGGCAINLVEKNRVAAFRQAIAEGYAKAFSRPPEIYVCAPAQGVERLDDEK
jgi:galactokinase